MRVKAKFKQRSTVRLRTQYLIISTEERLTAKGN